MIKLDSKIVTYSLEDLLPLTELAQIMGDPLFTMTIKDKDKQAYQAQAGEVIGDDRAGKAVYFDKSEDDLIPCSTKVYYVVRGIVKEVLKTDLARYKSFKRTFT